MITQAIFFRFGRLPLGVTQGVHLSFGHEMRKIGLRFRKCPRLFRQSLGRRDDKWLLLVEASL